MGDSRESAQSLSLGRKLVFSLVPIFLILGVAEFYFRLHPHRDIFETNRGFAEADPDLIWRLKPHASGPLATNELGLRDPTYDPDADVTVLLLGDSVSWGNGVDDSREVFSFLLERALDDRHPTRSIEVINSGVPGYSTFQQLRYLELHAADLAPDLVILQTCLNDAVERYWTLAEYGGNNEFMGVDTRRAVRGVYGFFLTHSRAFEGLARFFQASARARERYAVQAVARDALEPRLERAWNQMMEEIEAIRRTAAAQRLPLLLLFAPYRFQVETESAPRGAQDRWIAYADERGIPHVDVLAELTQLSRAPALRAFNDESHFSEDGHALVATLLVESVEKIGAGAGWFSSTGSPAQKAALLLDRAAATARLGDYQVATVLLDAAAAVAPPDARAHQLRANVAFLMGDENRAGRELQQGLALDPENALLRANLLRLRHPTGSAAE